MLGRDRYASSLVVLTGVWGIFTVWEQLASHDVWTVFGDEEAITQCLIQRNGTHFSMSGDNPSARVPLATSIGLDQDGSGVEEMMQGTFDMKRDR